MFFFNQAVSILVVDCEPRHATRIHKEGQSSGEKRRRGSKEKKPAEELAPVGCLSRLALSPNWHNFKFSSRVRDLRNNNRF